MSEIINAKKYIASLDIGTTSIRCFIYDINVHIVGRACANVIFFVVQFSFMSFSLCKMIKQKCKNSFIFIR